METVFGSLLFSKKQDKSGVTDDELHEIKADLENVLSKHGYELQQYEFLGLPEVNYPLAACSRCGEFTADFNVDEFQAEGVIEQFIAQVVRKGRVDDGSIVCIECAPT